MKYVFIVNPVAGNDDKKKLFMKLLTDLPERILL